MAEAAAVSGNGGNGTLSFRGVHELVLDAKGRLAIPTRHREALRAHAHDALIVTADQLRCLLIFPPAEWAPIEEKLNQLSGFDPVARQLQRRLVGHAEQVEIDSAGRILIPPPLRKYAGLDRQVALVGQGRKLELWDEAQWQAQTAMPIVLTPGTMPRGLEDLPL